MNNIAFYGPMCSGKTYLATHLIENYGYMKVGFADKLKAVARDLFEIDTKDKKDSTRKLLQGFSDDIKKWGGEDVFVKHLIHKLYELPGPFVIDDLRYTFEADALRSAGFKLVSVNTYENIRQERILKLYPDTSLEAQQHRSETDSKLIEPDYAAWSNTPEDLRQLDIWVLGKDFLYGKRDTVSLRR